MKRWIAVLVAIGCGSRAPSPPPRNVASARVTALDPPPPRGLVIPEVGRARDVHAGGSSVWEATFDVDPRDPRVAAVIEEHRPHGATEQDLAARMRALGQDTHEMTPGEAGMQLYVRQVEASGIACPDFDYPIQNGALSVTVIVNREGEPMPPTSFRIIVGTPGG